LLQCIAVVGRLQEKNNLPAGDYDQTDKFVGNDKRGRGKAREEKRRETIQVFAIVSRLGLDVALKSEQVGHR